MPWNCEEDLIVMEFSELVNSADELGVTKRTILKVMAGLYDPLGIVSLVPRLALVSGRILAKLVKTVMTALKEEIE